MTGRQYGTLAIAGGGAFVLAVVVLHFLHPEVSVVHEGISAYALADFGWLEQAAEFALGVGTVALALGLRETLAPGKRVTASWVLLVISGLAGIATAPFVTDPPGAAESTPSGAIHDIGGFVSLLFLLISAWMLRGVFARDDRFRRLARAELLLASLMTVSVVALLVLWQGPGGLIQRFFVLVAMSWLFALAAHLRQRETIGRAN
jgi:hypothetical protein